MRLGRPELVPGRSSARLAPRDPRPLSISLATPTAATTITMIQNHIHIAAPFLCPQGGRQACFECRSRTKPLSIGPLRLFAAFRGADISDVPTVG
jgi:hypothetical protein